MLRRLACEWNCPQAQKDGELVSRTGTLEIRGLAGNRHLVFLLKQ
jgi:hypothetical protein